MPPGGLSLVRDVVTQGPTPWPGHCVLQRLSGATVASLLVAGRIRVSVFTKTWGPPAWFLRRRKWPPGPQS